MRMLMRLWAFMRLGRPLFLIGGVVLHALGVAVALYNGATLNLGALLWGQVAITAVQWMTHYSNDYFDLHADSANETPTNWSGGSRVLTDGLMAPRLALITALAMAGAALFAAGVLAFVIGTAPLTMPLILLALLLAWFYSAPPLRLHSSGFGEITTTLLVAGLTPTIGFYLQHGQLEPIILLAIFPIMCLQFCMLLSVAFPDAVADRMVGKWTLIVRFGLQGAARVYVMLLGAAYVSLPVLVALGLPTLVALAVGLMSPLALWLAWCVHRGDYANPERWNNLAFFSIGLLTATAAVEALIFVLMSGLVNP